jgi:hypothetical protein
VTDEDYIAHALTASDLTREAFLADAAQLEVSPSRLTLREYVDYGLYDWNEHGDEARRAFLSDRLHWPFVARTCNFGWNAATEDKWLMETVLRRAGVPTPPILAVLDTSNRFYPGTFMIRSEESLRVFLQSNSGGPFFGKRLDGMASDGIFLCLESDREQVVLWNEGVMTVATLFERLRSHRYIFQPVIRNHTLFKGIAENLCTMRLAVFVYDDALKAAFGFMKVSQGENLPDHFKSIGNLALGLDLERGTITSVRRRLPIGTELLKQGPEVLALLGQQLPFWAEATALAARVAEVYAPVRFQSLDIAFTDSGPVVIEVNTGGGFGGPQLANARGLLQPNFRHFMSQARIDLAELGRGIG